MEQAQNKVCCVCFYTFRKLYSLGKSKNVFSTLLGEHSEYAKNLTNEATVACWECHRVLWKLQKFVEIANGSQETFFKAIVNLKMSKLPTLSASLEVVIDTTQQVFEEESDNEEMSCEETDKNETNSEAIKVKQEIEIEFEASQECTSEAQTSQSILKPNPRSLLKPNPRSLLKPNPRSLLKSSSKSLLKPTLKQKRLLQNASQSILKSISESILSNPSTSFSKSDRRTSFRKDLFVRSLDHYRSKEKYDLVIYNEREMYQERFETLDRLKLAQFFCKKCLKEFSSEELFAEHVNSEHMERPDTVMCEICETYVPNTRPRLASHKRSHYVRYRCEVCAILCDSSFSLYTHAAQHSKRLSGLCKKYRCTVCHRTFDEPGNCDRHEEIVLLENSQCYVCFKYFPSSYQFRNHLRTHTDLESLQCKVCFNWFKGHYNLMTHMKRHEKKDTVVHYCHECAVTFTSRNGLREHLKKTKKHNQDDELRLKFICNLCYKKFATKRAMKDHYKAIHLNHYYQCDICERKFTKKYDVRRHIMVTHLKIQRKRDCICEQCGKGFFSKHLLRDHMLVHSEDRTIQCPYCVATFKQKASQYNHIRLIHLNMKRNRSKPKKKQTISAEADDNTAIEKSWLE